MIDYMKMNSLLVFQFLILVRFCFVFGSPAFSPELNGSIVTATILSKANDFQRGSDFQSAVEGRDWFEVSLEDRKQYRFTISIPLDYHIYDVDGVKISDSTNEDVFLITNSTSCAENVRCLSGSEFSGLNRNDAGFSKDSLNTKSKVWEQLVSYTGNMSDISLKIIWNFADEKTVYERFENAKKVGEPILWEIKKSLNDSQEVTVKSLTGSWYFSSDDSDRSICSADNKLSHDDGMLGASRRIAGRKGVDGGKSPVPNDFWGHGNVNSKDTQCRYWYENGKGTIREQAVSWLTIPKRTSFTFSPPYTGNYFVSFSNQDMLEYSIRLDEIIDDYSSDNETESNIELNSVTEGQIDFISDVDWHRIPIIENLPYICKVEGVGVFIKSFRDSKGDQIPDLGQRKIEQNSFFGIETPPEVYFSAPYSGDIFLEIGGPQQSTYNILCEDLGEDKYSSDQFFFVVAGALPANSEVHGAIQTPGDHDWYEVILEAGYQYKFQINNIFGLVLRDANGNEVVSQGKGFVNRRMLRHFSDYQDRILSGNPASGGILQDFRNPGFFDENAFKTKSGIVVLFIPISSAKYYVDVGGKDRYGRNSEETALGSYTVSLDRFGFDPGDRNNITENKLKPGGSTIIQTFFGNLDHDLFHVDLMAGFLYQFKIDTPVQLKLSGADSDAVLLMETSESAQNVISSGDAWVVRDFEKGITELSFVPPSSGEYRFEVSRAFAFSVPGLFDEYVTPYTRYGVKIIGDDIPSTTSTPKLLSRNNGTLGALVNSPGDRDWFAIDLEPNETLNVVVEGQKSLRPSVCIRDVHGNLLKGTGANKPSFSSAAGFYQLGGPVFAIMNGKTCTSFIPCFDEPLLGIGTSSAFSTSPEAQGMLHNTWTQIISLHNAYYIDIIITWMFQDTKTLRERFDNAMLVGENVTWHIHTPNSGEVVMHRGTWRFTSGITPELICSSGILSKDGAAFGSSNSSIDSVDGNTILPGDFYGHGTFSGSSLNDCGKYYSNGVQDSESFVVSRLALGKSVELSIPQKQHIEFVPESSGLYFIDVGSHGFSTGGYCLDVTGASGTTNMSACASLFDSPAGDPGISPKTASNPSLRKSQIVNISVAVLFFAIIGTTIGWVVTRKRKATDQNPQNNIAQLDQNSKQRRGALSSRREPLDDDQESSATPHGTKKDLDNVDKFAGDINIDVEVGKNEKRVSKKGLLFHPFLQRQNIDQEIACLEETVQAQGLAEGDDEPLPDELSTNVREPKEPFRSSDAIPTQYSSYKRVPEPTEPYPFVDADDGQPDQHSDDHLNEGGNSSENNNSSVQKRVLVAPGDENLHSEDKVWIDTNSGTATDRKNKLQNSEDKANGVDLIISDDEDYANERDDEDSDSSLDV